VRVLLRLHQRCGMFAVESKRPCADDVSQSGSPSERNDAPAALNERERTGEGVRGIAKRFGVDPSTVQRISRPFAVAAE
jgi:hypothetical protein